MPALGLNSTLGTTDWGAFILERLRTESALLKAGARYIAITGKSMVVPRLLDDGSASWVDELQEIPSDAPDADTITLTPKKLGNVVTLSNESIADAPVSELDLVGNSLARSVAVAIDARVFSTAVETAIAPPGLLTSMTAAVGPVSFDSIISAIGSIEAIGGTASVVFAHPNDVTSLRLIKDTGGRPLLQPDLRAAGAESISGARVISTPSLPIGTVVICDPKQIILAVRKSVEVSFSAHSRFTADAVVARVTARATWALNDARGVVKLEAA